MIPSARPYRFLPFRFARRKGKVLLVNDVGDHLFLEPPVFEQFVSGQLPPTSDACLDLKSSFMLADGSLPGIVDLLATRYRSKKAFLWNFTSLHMIVVTLRCNQRCLYCHAASVPEESGPALDMSLSTARECAAMALRSPAPVVKIEFQGGEPLLNFDAVRAVVEHATALNESRNKDLQFVLCTNLLALDEAKLDFLRTHNVSVSTSLDGPEPVHDACRKRASGQGSYREVVHHLGWVVQELGAGSVSAMMTVTPCNLDRLRDVVDEYLLQGLRGIFLRMLNPFGAAKRNWSDVGYGVEDFLLAYRDALAYIIEVNRKGVHFPEHYAALLLARMMTPFSTGFVDLQSPAGTGISGVIYDTNGDAYVSDEARMFARTTGDKSFRIGNVQQDKWKDIFGSQRLREIVSASCIEALPGCAWCVYQPFCGGDPVRNYATQGSMVGTRPTNDFCRKHKGLFEILLDYMESEDDRVQDIFWSWITRRPCEALSPVENKGNGDARVPGLH